MFSTRFLDLKSAIEDFYKININHKLLLYSSGDTVENSEKNYNNTIEKFINKIYVKIDLVSKYKLDENDIMTYYENKLFFKLLLFYCKDLCNIGSSNLKFLNDGITKDILNNYIKYNKSLLWLFAEIINTDDTNIIEKFKNLIFGRLDNVSIVIEEKHFDLLLKIMLFDIDNADKKQKIINVIDSIKTKYLSKDKNIIDVAGESCNRDNTKLINCQDSKKIYACKGENGEDPDYSDDIYCEQIKKLPLENKSLSL
jgi:hypothetical protein